jgi:glycosyltransferase 2 family protein
LSPDSLLSKKLKTRLLFGVVFGVLVYLGIALWADGPAIAEALRGFPLQWVLAAMGLSFLNYVVRFARWERYRAILGIEMGRWTSFRIYLAGLALTVTPGKMGEAFRSVLIRAEDGTPIARSAPMVIAERFTDLLGFLILVAIGGIASSPEHAWVFWATAGLCAFLLFLVGSRKVGRLVIAILARLPFVHRFVSHAEHALDSSRVLLAPKELPLPTIISTFGWGCECYGFYLVCEALVPGGAPFLFAVYTYALAAIAGAVLLIFPGGLGVTEASMGGLLAHRYQVAGLAKDVAAAKALSATFLIRLCTLWFAVGVGLVAMGWHSRVRRDAALVRDHPEEETTEDAERH